MQAYEEAVDFIDHIGKYGTHPGVENTARLLGALGRPEHRLKIIHVAGTNGKGSVCAFLADMLTAKGRRVGLFTSPHLVDIRERIQLGREMIDKEDFAEYFLRVKKAAEELACEGYTGITYFDYLFAIALCWYETQMPDYVVVETGLGGRLDSTNAISNPVLTIITSISLDHTEILGDTIEKIAAEKAGILKTGVPLIYCADEPGACKVIKRRAQEMAVPCIGIGRQNCKRISEDTAGADKKRALTFTFCLPAAECAALNGNFQREDADSPEPYPDGILEHLTVNSPALYQAENAAIAYTAAIWLYLIEERADGLSGLIPNSLRTILRRALACSVWEGRFEEIAPNVYLDGAHNADGIRMLLASLRPIAAGHSVTLLFTTVKEKDTDEMIREICESGLFCRYLITTVGGARAIAPESLKETFLTYTDVPVTAYTSPQEAFAAGLEQTGAGGTLSEKIIRAQKHSLSGGKTPDKTDQILLCAGSLYLVGIIKELLLANKLNFTRV